MGSGSLIDKSAQAERDESAPDWAKGYDVEDLKRITTLFERHDEGLVPRSTWATHLVFTWWLIATQMRLAWRCSATRRLRRSKVGSVLAAARV
jgi:hypothetical protein